MYNQGMKREIKFIAWDKIESKMVNLDPMDIEYDDDYGCTMGFICEGSDLRDESKIEDFELMQYTGVKDAKGVEIYEGDVVKAKAKNEYKEDDTISDIIFDPDGGWCIRSISGDFVHHHGLSVLWGGWLEVEVIGNIYENSDLLTNK